MSAAVGCVCCYAETATETTEKMAIAMLPIIMLSRTTFV